LLTQKPALKIGRNSDNKKKTPWPGFSCTFLLTQKPALKIGRNSDNKKKTPWPGFEPGNLAEQAQWYFSWKLIPGLRFQ